ncbi:chaplin [Streptomyces longwoodensis]|uniref:Chaplin n=1 Tax=Streptomyces lasalocidi TaxID=324833 RepID=A0A4U5WCP5_STRLS|nr:MULTISPECIES: chaplin [Streptomyces]TKS99289.1 chaplin [Streptomyces lasalocidi]
MRRVARNGVIAFAAASGAMAVVMPAHADSSADAAAVGSPGAASGNAIQLPVDVPVNVCGNTVNVVGLLNPAAGNACANTGARDEHASSGAAADAEAAQSPGLVSGNGVQLPVDLPVNVSGNTVDVVGIANPVMGNTSVNGPGDTHGEEPSAPEEPTAQPPRHVPPAPEHEHEPGGRAASGERTEAQSGTVTALASTGADATFPALVGSTAMILGGAALYRRFRTTGRA